jgi:predicted branched-subunit amino acid permease
MRTFWRTPGRFCRTVSSWRTLDQGTLRDIAMVCLADSIVGASFGAVAVTGGLRPWVPVVMSLLVFAGGGQIAAVGVVLGGGGAVAAVAAGLVLNTRMLPYGFGVADVLGGRWPARLAGAHLTVDESVAFAAAQPGPERRRAAFWTCGVALFVCWNIAVAVGALAGTALGNTGALGLDAAFPAVLLALVLPALADRGVRRAALAGAALAVAATPFLPAGLPALLALAGLLLAGRPAPAAQAR